jgi:indolepyruvate ferredoxin oxidoreductase alpha subunit
MKEDFFLGNGAIALGLLEAGCQVLTSYPGTPSSEILPEAVRMIKSEKLNTYVEWSTNEKVALDNAYAAAITGKRSACIMKQVGLNVAADSLMSAAYLGTVGGLVIISCDDPGPHSSQTEQDTRLMARLAKVPVLDPSNPQEAREMVQTAFELSEKYRIPVILRPAIRVCHARQNLTWGKLQTNNSPAAFQKDPRRWAATPKFRFLLHKELNKKLKEIAEEFNNLHPYNTHNLKSSMHFPLGVIAGGVPSAVIKDILDDYERKDIPLLKIGAPYPFPDSLAMTFLQACDKVLVIEETDTLIEYSLRDREKVLGRFSNHVPSEGELVPQIIEGILEKVLTELDLPSLNIDSQDNVQTLVNSLELPIRKPTLCPGCGHRAAFYSIRKSRPKAIFTSDIGCYTLGLNLGSVDTVLDMGAAITMASGFHHAYAQDGQEQPIVATIGDSTFFHSGPAGLLNAVYNDARFVLVILDNMTTAMTGMQPTPSLGIRADGSQGKKIPLERLISGCGIDYIEVVDPYELKNLRKTLKKAFAYVKDPDGGIAVVIARHPCIIAYRDLAIQIRKNMSITDDCIACNHCIDRFECPALYHDSDRDKTAINPALCIGCAVCVDVCPKGAIIAE